ncbi:hypothetical protein [Sphingobacterium multivorum]|uniref:hypothetical protein n=1 Tax=Sphingobacterium multivorum TaxID=28454 RepID=UPI0028B064D3|nr:hypothetical protein [Sphingobacterium multivorum]
MNNQQAPERSVMDEVIENLIKKTEFLEIELTKKNEALLAKEAQTQALLADFEKKYGNLVIQSPEPDLARLESILKNSLMTIGNNIEAWPKPFRKEYRISFFPEQTKSVEYVSAVLTRLIIGVVAILFLIFSYMLLDKNF